MIVLPNLIPNEQRVALSLAINRGDTDQVKYLVEEYGLDVDAFLDDSSFCMPVIMDALLSSGFSTEAEKLVLLRYLLERGANPNICCRKGYNCLHIAVQQDRYIRALDLFLDFHADVNVPDADGANIIYWAIQRFLLWRDGDGADESYREEFLRVLGKILRLGADLDQSTRYEMTARGWLEHAAPEVRELVAQWEEGKPVILPVTTVQPRFPTHLQYPGVAKKIWSESVPAAGPATSVHGELLRMVETLREEAGKSGDVRLRKEHKRMIAFVRNILVRSGAFDKATIEQIRLTTDELSKGPKLYAEDDVYDQLVDHICMFYQGRQVMATG